MTQTLPPEAESPKVEVVVRPVQHRDLEAVERLLLEAFETDYQRRSIDFSRQLRRVRRWFAPLKVLSWLPGRFQHFFCTQVAEQAGQIVGVIQVSPFNRSHSTWRVDHVAVDVLSRGKGIGSRLLRHCFENFWQARTWLLEVEVNNKSAMSLYRENGFQPLAQITYWSLSPELQEELRQHQPDLPNLLPVSNADAQLLHQLDTAAMPPLVRQVYDRHIDDFKLSLISLVLELARQLVSRTAIVSGYIYEPQRKAAIGHFHLRLSRNGTQPHMAQMTVHPAYTWLYPELVAQMAQITAGLPPQQLQLASTDYQPEREAYLERVQADRVEHTLLMSRSVWHKVREWKPAALEGLQLASVIPGFQPAHKPVPGRIEAEPAVQPVPLKLKVHPRNSKGDGPSQSPAS
ncbi:GNAT family N-acetyltransferase [Leptolyngbya sp. FACHB-261]|uniref:GNAT family N-acetyltransferase n=1 Tax=Leptolyngbya sp. FACHB-261 TaxID=2692806 RepID=UPI0016886DA8|nr:GNAT family N-acetyltransferase [Leptolyngbya sp. FACHB-261]MBD2099405.1 GNAT family N-acetyltransferase [Leptolyngbya sp. FACHB-261]